MNKKESNLLQEQMGLIYRGILANNSMSTKGCNTSIKYELNCPEFNELKNKYNLVEIVGKGSDFTKAKRLLHYLAPKLYHSSYYDNHIKCNALDLLEYSFDNKEQGINCLNKSKILQECLMAIGIYARRVSMMPYSPFDMDNHVVTEMYDRKLKKWIMLDPTTDIYMVDQNNTPLSLLEMRQLYSNNSFLVPIGSNKKKVDLNKLYNNSFELNTYYAKNCFYFMVDEYSTFGEKGEKLKFSPSSFDFGNLYYQNAKFRVSYFIKHKDDFENDILLNLAKEKLEEAKENIEVKVELTSLNSYLTCPIK